mgnify:CR=1 FL=1
MDKQRIKGKVIAAYKDARQYPDFMERFKANVQDVIDSEVPEEITHSADVYHDIEYLSQTSKQNNDSAANYLRIMAGYVAMIVKAVEQGNKKLDMSATADLFDEDEDFNPNNFQ